MAIVINSNLAAMNARKNLAISQDALATSIARLSSGQRITRASDDAAGLAISEKLNAQIRGFSVASRNASNAISVVSTAEGTLNEVTSLLTRMRELAVQAASGDLGSAERGNLDTEFKALLTEIDRMVAATAFNGQNLFSTGATVTTSFQIGINSGDTLAVAVAQATVSALSGGLVTQNVGVTNTISTAAAAAALLGGIDAAISGVTTNRGALGAAQNRLESIVRNLAVTIETSSAANSRIRDVDVAEETATYTKNQILVQAGVSVLAQANQAPQIALSLLGGR